MPATKKTRKASEARKNWTAYRACPVMGPPVGQQEQQEQQEQQDSKDNEIVKKYLASAQAAVTIAFEAMVAEKDYSITCFANINEDGEAECNNGHGDACQEAVEMVDLGDFVVSDLYDLEQGLGQEYSQMDVDIWVTKGKVEVETMIRNTKQDLIDYLKSVTPE
jgi:hypothetical protein